MGGYKGMRSYFPIPPRLWNLLSNIRATPPAPLTVLSDAQLPYFQCLQPVVLIELKFLYHIARPAVIIYMIRNTMHDCKELGKETSRVGAYSEDAVDPSICLVLTHPEIQLIKNPIKFFQEKKNSTQ
ncbi:hypothetical protein AAG906_001865 [Vitis piasezkii]